MSEGSENGQDGPLTLRQIPETEELDQIAQRDQVGELRVGSEKRDHVSSSSRDRITKDSINENEHTYENIVETEVVKVKDHGDKDNDKKNDIIQSETEGSDNKRQDKIPVDDKKKKLNPRSVYNPIILRSLTYLVVYPMYIYIYLVCVCICMLLQIGAEDGCIYR